MSDSWYSASDGAGWTGTSRGERYELRGGGPLDGRYCHSSDLLCALWVASDAGQLIVSDGLDVPTLPARVRVLGRYVANPEPRAFEWHPLEIPPGAAQRLAHVSRIRRLYPPNLADRVRSWLARARAYTLR